MKPQILDRALVRLAAVLALAIPLSTAGDLLSAAPAHAQALAGSLSFVSDPGDFIGGGLSAAYSTADGDAFAVTNLGSDQGVDVSVRAANSDWWDLYLAAPTGQKLTAGTYTGVAKWPYNQAGPSLWFYGNSRDCNTLTGSFTVTNVSFGPYGYVHQLDATYVQHCDGAAPALTGEVHMLNPPPPPALATTVAVAPDGTASRIDGRATVSGQVTCNVPAVMHTAGTVTQVVKKSVITGNFITDIACTPGAPVPWSAEAIPNGSTPLQQGDARVDVQAVAADPFYGVAVSVDTTAVVRLRWAHT
jgi:hypothetical protein